MSKTVDWAIGKAFLHAQRKSSTPANGTSKYNALLAIADSMQKLWADETEWDSLYQHFQITPLVTATDTFVLDDEIDTISERSDDRVIVTNGTNSQEFLLVSPDELYKYRFENACAKVGQNLVFSKPFDASSSLIGYNIQVPIYGYVPDITAGTDVIVVDRPMWLAYMMAAEFVRNDVVKQGQYDNLIALADEVMNKMLRANGGQIESVAMPWTPQGESW